MVLKISRMPYLTVLIAVVVAWIAWQQHLLGQEKFKLDLFEKRFAIYRATLDFLAVIGTGRKIDATQPLEFFRETHDATFLFGQEIEDYLDGLYKKAIDMIVVQEKIGLIQAGPEKLALIDAECELRMYFANELPKLKDVFAPYLQFRLWKSAGHYVLSSKRPHATSTTTRST